MNTQPAFMFFSKDFICATLGRTLEEKGELITLAAYQHQMGHMSEDTVRGILGKEMSDFVRMLLNEDEEGLLFFEGMDGEPKESSLPRPGRTVKKAANTRKRSEGIVQMKAEAGEEKNAYGTYSNVMLTDVEYERLNERYGLSLETRINQLSSYMKMKGKRYDCHYAVIIEWDEKNKAKAAEDNGFQESTFDTDDFFNAAIEKSRRYYESLS